MRRSGASGKSIKMRRRKKVAPKRRNAPKAVRHRSSSPAEQETEVAQLRRELSEAREQQAASAEVLKTISSSPGDLEPVFDVMLQNATRICEAKFGTLYLYDGNAFRPGAMLGAPRSQRPK